MNVVKMVLKILLVANGVFPKPSLPVSLKSLSFPACGLQNFGSHRTET